MKTKKQKTQEIPKIEKLIQELEIDLLKVENQVSKTLIEDEIKKQKETLRQYQVDIQQPNNRHLR